MENAENNIAQIGLGYWGKNIFRNLCEMKVLNTACDSSAETIAERRQSFADVNFTHSLDEILENDAIKALVISTPAVTHHKIAKQALEKGKDVFIEKPLALTVKDGEELVAIAKRNKRILMIGHILQFHPAVIKLKELISKGDLGKIQYIYSNRLNIGKLRVEENILWSFAPHDISVILSLLGEEPVKVAAYGGDYLNKSVYDTTMTVMEFKNHVKGHIFVSWLHPIKEQKFVIVGSEAMAVFDDMSDEKLKLYPHKIDWIGGKVPVAKKSEYKTVPIEQGEPLKLELTHFVECIRDRKTPKTDGEEGLRVLKVLELAEDSLAGKEVDLTSERTEKYFVHVSSYVDDNVSIGNGSKIWHFSHLLRNTTLGKNCVVGQNVTVGPDVSVGNNCKIQNNVSVYKGVTLEDDVFCGPSCVFTNVYTPRAFIERKSEFAPTLVKKGSSIGANATILCGVTLGKYSLIGAGAVVKADVPDYAIVAGVPAKKIGWACKCGVPLKSENQEYVCSNCKSSYSLVKENLVINHEGGA